MNKIKEMVTIPSEILKAINGKFWNGKKIETFSNSENDFIILSWTRTVDIHGKPNKFGSQTLEPGLHDSTIQELIFDLTGLKLPIE